MKYVVFHTVRAGNQVKRTAKLAVTEVPEKTSAQAVMNVLEEAGRAMEFSEAGIPWGNHEVKSDKNLPQNTDTTGVTEVTWEQLQSTREIRRITLRFDARDYTNISRAAQQANKSMQQWCAQTLLDAAAKQTAE